MKCVSLNLFYHNRLSFASNWVELAWEIKIIEFLNRFECISKKKFCFYNKPKDSNLRLPKKKLNGEIPLCIKLKKF